MSTNKKVFIPRANIRVTAITLILSSVFVAQDVFAYDIKDIARQFLKRTESVYGEKVERNPFDQVPDGSPLLMRPSSNKYFYKDDIYALKQNGDIYLSFEDTLYILEFPITLSDDNLTADGWFIREDWPFSVNFETMTGQAKGQEFKIQPSDVIEQDGIRFIRGTTMANWFDIEFDYDITQQTVDIKTQYPLPTVARNLRQKNTNYSSGGGVETAQLPRLEQEKSNFDINTMDVAIGTRYNKDTLGNTTQSQTGSAILEGEVLKHNAFFYINQDSTNGLNNITSRLSKRSENPDLLGRLRARSYEIGDVDTTNIPLTGSASQDLGFRFDNNRLDNTDFASTDIEGDSLPDWDVQLYRNDVLIDTQTVGQDGRYSFDNIRLFIGQNDFELFFFGPQGEIRSEQLTVPVSQELLAGQDGTYEVSMTLEDTQTYQQYDNANANQGQPHLAIRYNKLISDNSLGYIGARTRDIQGERKLFLSSGLSTTLGQILVDSNFAIDEQGNGAAEAILRRQIAGWDTSLSAQINSDDYVTSETQDPPKMQLSFNAQRAIKLFDNIRASLLANATYLETVSGTSVKNADIGISNNLLGANISNRLRYDSNNISTSSTSNTVDYGSEDRLSHELSVRKSFGPFYLRAGTSYNIKPEAEFASLIGQINYQHSNKLSGDITLQRQLQTDTDTARINANYTHEKFRLSPFFQIDSDDAIQAGLNVNFALSDKPNARYPDITSKRLAGRGAVSALVYYDKNGNLVFDGQDEPLPDTILSSLNIRRRAPVGKDGYALINDLSTNQATDITLDTDSLPDPFMISANEGNSIMPEAGTIYNMEFPVHMTGEIDGTVAYYDEDNMLIPSGYHTLDLLSLDHPEKEPIKVRTESDGYYVAYMLPPGNYLVVPEDKGGKFGNTIPQAVQIGYEGTIVKDMDIVLEKDKPYVPYAVATTKTPEPFLRIKNPGKSELAQTLQRMIQEKFTADLMGDLQKIPSPNAQDDGYEYYQSTTNDVQFYHEKCAALRERKTACEVVLPSKGV